MKVNYLCPFAQKNGVARAAHDYCMALLAADVDLTIVPIFPCDTGDLDVCYEPLANLATDEWPSPDPNAFWVVHAMPQDALDLQNDLPECAARVLVTTWETSHIPMEFTSGIDGSFDAVFVPSEHCKHALRSCNTPILVVPHALHSDWVTTPKFWPGANTDPYTFYSIGAWGERKNLLGLIKAYWTEFGRDESVRLEIKTNRIDEYSLAALKMGMNLGESLASIRFHTGHWPLEQIRDFHNQHCCYVTATRGEGWNLGAFEACAMGNPIIATDWGGQVDFLQRYEGWHRELSYTLTPAVWTESMSIRHISAREQSYEMRAIESVAPNGINGRQHWAQPDLFYLQSLMRNAFASQVGWRVGHRQHNPDTTQRALFGDLFSYHRIGELFRASLGAIRENA